MQKQALWYDGHMQGTHCGTMGSAPALCKSSAAARPTAAAGATCKPGRAELLPEDGLVRRRPLLADDARQWRNECIGPAGQDRGASKTQFCIPCSSTSQCAT